MSLESSALILCYHQLSSYLVPLIDQNLFAVYDQTMAGILKNNRLRGYSQAALNSAVISHQNGGMSIRKAAKDNGIPYTTSRDYLLESEKGEMGRPTKFSGSEEQAIARILINFADTNLIFIKFVS